MLARVTHVLKLALLPVVAALFIAPAPMQQQQQTPIAPKPKFSVTQTIIYSATSTPVSPQPAEAVIGWVASSPPNGLVADLHCYDGETVTNHVKFVEFVPGSVGGFFSWEIDTSNIYTANLTATFPGGGVAEANTLYF